MDILMVAAELSPYVRATEAADAIAALSKTLRQLGHEVTLALPRYPGFEEHGLLVARRLTPLTLLDGTELTLLDGQLSSGVRLVLFDAPDLYQRPGVFGEDGKDYPDNAMRFGKLAQAAAALVCQRAEQGQQFDVVHLHDWPTALVPVALSRMADLPVPTVLTVHDMRRQGVFPAKELPALGVPKEMNTDTGLKLDGKVNVLKGGILFSDVVATTSEAFIDELARDDKLGALPRFVERRGVAITGVLNGIDYATLNPATDPILKSRYDAEDAACKGIVKTDLLRSLQLQVETSRPLVVAFGEIRKETGLDVLVSAIGTLMDSDLTLVVAGEGGATLVKKVQAQAKRRPETLAYIDRVDAAGARRLVGAADLCVICNRHSPAGTRTALASRYGAVPVARATGAVSQIVVDCDSQLETGTGFLFDELTAEALTAAVQRGVAAYLHPGWEQLRRRVMRQDLGWDRPARRYVQLYKQAILAKGN
jgi:starch synthase